ncbi:MAG: homoserine O-succinyltransferase [Gammaproteobacteria bacterium]|nr:homoserine O-succinyltransferase [Gammaproteobacteria bacterium]
MPLVANTNLPSFVRLRNEGETILHRDDAVRQDIRELHIGLLNMMPGKALEATERQFFRLIGESNQIAQFYIHPFSLDGLERDATAQAHVDEYYKNFDEIKTEGLDALIITGANVIGPELSNQVFWKPLIEVFDWAVENVTSILCSCLATHAVLQFRYQQQRRALVGKRWGVYSHRVSDRSHPLVAGVNTRFDVPHSRFNQVDRAQFDEAGITVLVETEEGDVHLAVSEDDFRIVFFQGHPEYDTISLLKEYKREVGRFLYKETDIYPPFPENYFGLRNKAILEEFQEHICLARDQGTLAPDFPEDLIIPALDNTWHDSGEAVINNWIGKVYQLTHLDRRLPFREGIDPANPLAKD